METETYSVQTLNLGELHGGLPAITPEHGSSLAQAGAVCLEDQGHSHGVNLSVKGSCEIDFSTYWPPVNEQARRCWNDPEEATEYGACAVALLLIVKVTEYTVIERSRKGTGFDYWLGKTEDEIPFQNQARLEVSGIREGTSSKISSRVKQKLRQISISDGSLPAFVVVVEFSSPESQLEKK